MCFRAFGDGRLDLDAVLQARDEVDGSVLVGVEAERQKRTNGLGRPRLHGPAEPGYAVIFRIPFLVSY
jgi:hypothetical protein